METHGDARTPHRVPCMPKEARLRKQDRVRARSSPPASSPSPQRMASSLFHTAPHAHRRRGSRCESGGSGPRGRRDDARDVGSSHPRGRLAPLLIWQFGMRYAQGQAGGDTYGVAPRRGRGRPVRTDPLESLRAVEVGGEGGRKGVRCGCASLLLCGPSWRRGVEVGGASVRGKMRAAMGATSHSVRARSSRRREGITRGWTTSEEALARRAWGGRAIGIN
ncbi:hypothetical protein B0H13DRAFT_124193 [Mycena leptocephala]|nr:hypothetical protein B0H13DRAFT_124193 [Mycena leptocephala]